MTPIRPVVARSPGNNRNLAGLAQLVYANQPSLQAFDVASGKLLWAAKLAAAANQPFVQVRPPQICRSHLALLAKAQSYRSDSKAMIIDAQSGKVAQLVTVSGAPVVAGRSASESGFCGWTRRR